MNEIARYPETTIKVFRLTFDMKKRDDKSHHFITIIIPAVSEEAVRNTVPGLCFEISEATNNQYILPRDQSISVVEVEKVRMFTENVNDDS